MVFGAIEIITTILIVFGLAKLVVLLIKPKALINLSSKIYDNPLMAQIIAFILGGVILYYLIQSGMTIVQIFAVVAFTAMLFVIGLAKFGKKLMKMANTKHMWADHWFYILIWLVLMVWAIKALFF